jgi:hypothetical protein
VLNQYLRNYVGTYPKYWGEHLGSVEFYYNSTTHSMTKMSLFELKLGKEARKSMDLAIPMGRKYHSEEAMEMDKGHEDKYA